jgi:hypothetical protein
MMKKYLTIIALVVALVGFGLVLEVRADASFGGTGSVSAWGGAASSGAVSTFSGSSSSSSSGNSSGGGGPGGNCGHKTCKVPEPSIFILLLCGMVGMVVVRKRALNR